MRLTLVERLSLSVTADVQQGKAHLAVLVSSRCLAGESNGAMVAAESIVVIAPHGVIIEAFCRRNLPSMAG
jgi:hypothetical protein